MSHRRLLFIVPFLLSVAALVMVAGCGGKSSDEDLVLEEDGPLGGPATGAEAAVVGPNL